MSTSERKVAPVPSPNKLNPRPSVTFPDGLNPHAGLYLKETVYDGTSYVCPTWEQMGRFNFLLAKQIIEGGHKFDRMVALSRGGLTWARDLMDKLKIPEISPVRIKLYGGVNQAGEPKIVQPLTDSVHGERILLFDEVIDSGITLALVKPYVEIMGAKEVTTATLCYKPRSRIKPDFFAFSTSSWVVFPHEIREFTEESASKWRLGLPEKGKPGISDIEILNRLLMIGLPREEVEEYLGLSKPK